MTRAPIPSDHSTPKRNAHPALHQRRDGSAKRQRRPGQARPSRRLRVSFERAATNGIAASLTSDQPAFGEGNDLAPGDDEVIERADVNERQRLLERLRQELVRPGRFGDARGMVVGEDHGGSVS